MLERFLPNKNSDGSICHQVNTMIDGIYERSKLIHEYFRQEGVNPACLPREVRKVFGEYILHGIVGKTQSYTPSIIQKESDSSKEKIAPTPQKYPIA